MKTFLVIIVSAAITWIAFSIIQGVRTGAERLWLISAIKAPGRMAISEIQTDMDAGRYDLARAKLKIFMDTWQRFDRGPDAFGGRGIGDVMVAFSSIDTNQAPISEPKGPASGSQPIRSETNRTSSAADSRR